MVDEEDQMLPIANVGRIMKQILPPNAKISKEAKQTMQECATEFISFVTGEATDKCHKENRKTVNGDDICWALSSLGFDNYAESIARYLHKYREAERDKAANNNSRNKSTSTSNQDKANEANQETSYKSSESGQQIEAPASLELEFRTLEKGNSSSPTKPPP